MSEWWTYRPASFLMFSPRIYWRLFESLNDAAWPAQWVLAGTVLGWLLVRTRMPMLRAAAVLFALCWAFSAWAFLLQRFAPINWPMAYVAAAFGVQGGGLLVLAAAGRLRGAAGTARARAGVALGLWAVLGHPLLGLAFGRPWRQAEFFGLAPDPTALATLAWLLLVEPVGAASRRLVRLLWIVPLAWCAISAAMLWTLGSVQGWVVGGLALLAAAAATRPRP